MIKILFVCHGNICRSPMAEFIFKKLIKEKGIENNFIVNSAATSTEEIGSNIYPPARKCLDSHNIPYNKHLAKQINISDLDYYDYIIAMEKYNIDNLKRMLGFSNKYSLLLDFDGSGEDISDPWYTGDFELAYKQINQGCICLINKILMEEGTI